jgi:hypothetical protein
MKSHKLIILILIVFLKTGNVLSDNNTFNVNNIEVEKDGKITNTQLANQAINEGFKNLLEKILLEEDSKKLSELKFSEIKELVTYYQVSNKKDDNNDIEKINFNISFDKDKIHDLFYKKGVSVPYQPKDSAFLEIYKDVVYQKYNTASSKHCSTKNIKKKKPYKNTRRVIFFVSLMTI